MEVLFRSCCGLDVHAQTVVACLFKEGHKTTRTFSTMTGQLLSLADWLVSEECQKVAIESTGIYWRPVFNILEGLMPVMLVNARHVKAVPGRKTDVRDCEWLADLLRHGLLKPSFIPPPEIRELRELTRYRQTLVKDKTSVANRVQRIAESGNIKLSQVASDALGKSARLMLSALSEGETNSQKLAQLARGRLRNKQAQLEEALIGRLTQAQKFVLKELLDHYEQLEAALLRVTQEIEREIAGSQNPFVAQAVDLLQTIPGVGQQVAEVVVSEIGVEMACFPSDKHLASWAGMCPGSHESAGKQKSGRRRHGNLHLQRMLTQAAWSATRTKGTYLAAQYKRLVRHKGKQRALVAVGHSILIIAYHLLSSKASYQELGGNYFDQLNVENQQRRLINKLEALGVKVTIEGLPLAA
jgi:transposase